jgi:hypothetical protein
MLRIHWTFTHYADGSQASAPVKGTDRVCETCYADPANRADYVGGKVCREDDPRENCSLCGERGECPPRLTLRDDGSMDTLLHCAVCDQTIRYSDFKRDASGNPCKYAIRSATEEHSEDCMAEESSVR